MGVTFCQPLRIASVGPIRLSRCVLGTTLARAVKLFAPLFCCFRLYTHRLQKESTVGNFNGWLREVALELHCWQQLAVGLQRTLCFRVKLRRCSQGLGWRVSGGAGGAGGVYAGGGGFDCRGYVECGGGGGVALKWA